MQYRKFSCPTSLNLPNFIGQILEVVLRKAHIKYDPTKLYWKPCSWRSSWSRLVNEKTYNVDFEKMFIFFRHNTSQVQCNEALTFGSFPGESYLQCLLVPSATWAALWGFWYMFCSKMVCKPKYITTKRDHINITYIKDGLDR